MATVQYINPGREPDLTTEQAAAYLGISPTTLIAWRCTKRHQIQFRKIGRLVRYRQEDLDAFLDSTLVVDSVA